MNNNISRTNCIFVSESKVDKQRVNRFSRKLKERSHQIYSTDYIDSHPEVSDWETNELICRIKDERLNSGDKVYSQVFKKIEECIGFSVFLSKESTKSKHVIKELSRFHEILEEERLSIEFTIYRRFFYIIILDEDTFNTGVSFQTREGVVKYDFNTIDPINAFKLYGNDFEEEESRLISTIERDFNIPSIKISQSKGNILSSTCLVVFPDSAVINIKIKTYIFKEMILKNDKYYQQKYNFGRYRKCLYIVNINSDDLKYSFVLRYNIILKLDFYWSGFIKNFVPSIFLERGQNKNE